MKDFIRDRNEALTSGDKEKIIAYCKKYNIKIPEDEKLLWTGVHKAICNLYLTAIHSGTEDNITEKQFNASYKWLRENGYNPFNSVGGEENVW